MDKEQLEWFEEAEEIMEWLSDEVDALSAYPGNDPGLRALNWQWIGVLTEATSTRPPGRR